MYGFVIKPYHTTFLFTFLGQIPLYEPQKCTRLDECLYKSDNGDLLILKLVGKNLSVIVYAPNDHNEEYFDHLKDIMLDIQIVHPKIPVIMLGDFNIVFEDRDSINPQCLFFWICTTSRKYVQIYFFPASARAQTV